MAWIKVVEPEEATGALKKEYDAAVERAGKVAVHPFHGSHVHLEAARDSERREWIHYTPKLLPQPQPLFSLGLTNLKPCRMSVCSQSRVVPAK